MERVLDWIVRLMIVIASFVFTFGVIVFLVVTLTLMINLVFGKL